MIPSAINAPASVSGHQEQKVISSKRVPMSNAAHHANLEEILRLPFGEVEDAFVSTERDTRLYHLKLRTKPVEVIAGETPIYHVGTRTKLGFTEPIQGVLQELVQDWGINHDPSVMPKDIPTKDLGDQTRKAFGYVKALYEQFYKLHTSKGTRLINFLFRR